MYQKQEKSRLRHLDFIVWDIIVLIFSFILAYFVRIGFRNPYLVQEYLAMGILMVLFQMVITILNDNYKDILQRGDLVEFKSVFVQNAMLMLFVFAFMFLTKQQPLYSRAVFYYTWIFCTCFMYLERLFWKRFVRNKLRTNDDRARMLVISDEANLETDLKQLQVDQYSPHKIVGAVIYNKAAKGRQVGNVSIVADWNEVFDYTRKEIVDEVFLGFSVSSAIKNAVIRRFLDMGIIVHIGLDRSEEMLPNQIVQSVGSCSVITTCIKTATVYQLLAKRAMDVAGSLIGLVFTGVLFLFLAPIIYIQSPGPVLFSQERVGRNGRRFRIYKFRSMYLDAEERKKELLKDNKMSGFMFKMDDDPRIIPIGKFIRKYSLDEFPQFWNILKGDMSLVGTRPPTVDEFEQYEERHKVRLSIKPGLTGMWQVKGRSDITDFEEVVQLDNKYIAEWNLRLDIKIILETVKVVLQSKGSV